jgi:maleylacetoacetate isomerase
MADFCLIPQVYNARRWGADISSLSRILRIDAECAALPAFAHGGDITPSAAQTSG